MQTETCIGTRGNPLEFKEIIGIHRTPQTMCGSRYDSRGTHAMAIHGKSLDSIAIHLNPNKFAGTRGNPKQSI